MERVALENSDVKLWVHNPTDCIGESCSIHNRSDHSMREFPQHWRSDRALMERICPHGIGHPDPDHMSYLMLVADGYMEVNGYEGVHGCDGCCRM